MAVSNPVVQHSGGLAIAQATCPTGTQPLGGGGLTTSPAFAVNMNSTLPTANGWRVDESDFFSEADSQLIAVAVCGSVRGYSVVAGDTATTPAGAQTISRAICPTGKVPTGGGVISFSASQIVFINTTAPSGIEWDTYMNNRTDSDVTERAIAVCVRAPA